MLKNKLKQLNGNDGFTIIEVIIVLVIAAVIMLAVFLIVPQLQRSQQNTRRQDMARRFLTAAQQFTTNNQGTMPAAGNNGDVLALVGAIRDPGATADLAATNVTVDTSTAAAATTPAPTVTGNVVIYTNRICNGTVAGAPQTGSMAVVISLNPNTQTYCITTN
jgi:prepilin-type N-terminal cleavage/methylation domain-containing protein